MLIFNKKIYKQNWSNSEANMKTLYVEMPIEDMDDFVIEMRN